MKKISIGVQKEFCAECSLALSRFIGKMDGVESVDVEDGRIAIAFDPSKITEDKVSSITRENIERLGYKLTE